MSLLCQWLLPRAGESGERGEGAGRERERREGEGKKGEEEGEGEGKRIHQPTSLVESPGGDKVLSVPLGNHWA